MSGIRLNSVVTPPHWFWIVLAGVITISPLPDLSAQSQQDNVLTDGDFASVSNGFFSGWRLGGCVGGHPDKPGEFWNNKATMEVDDQDKPMLKMACLDEGGVDFSVSQNPPLILNPNWTGLLLEAEMRVEDYVRRSEWGGRVMIEAVFSNDEATIPGEFYVGVSSNKLEWSTLSKEIVIPPGATKVMVQIRIIGANAVAYVRNVRAFPR